MLNELSELHKSLQFHGIDIDSWHPWIKPLKKGESVLLRLDENAEVKELVVLSKEETGQLRNIAPDNQKSFPGFNLKCPIVQNSGEDLSPQNLVSLAKNLVDPIEVAYEEKDLRRLKRILVDFPVQEILPALALSEDTKLAATIALLKRLQRNEPKAESFLQQFARTVSRACQEGKIAEELASSILFGKFNKKSQKYDEWSLTLLLDVSDLETFPYGVNDSVVAKEWSRALFHSAKPEEKTEAKVFHCSLTGKQDIEFHDKFPEPTLPFLGKTYLLSMNAEIPCQTRYGRIGSSIFPVGAGSVQQLQDAIQAVTKEEFRKRLWTGVPNESRDQNDLLISYLEEQPLFEAPIVSYFSGETDERDLSTYAARTAKLHEALELNPKVREDSYIRIFVLSQIDKGRKQVLFSKRYSVRAVYRGRDRWIAGTENVPSVRIPYPQGKGKTALLIEKTTPDPTQVMGSFKKQWIRKGEVNSSIPGVALGRIYDLLLDPHPEKQAQWLMELYVSRTEPLLLGLGESLHGSMFDRKVMSDSSRREAHTVVAVYGLLLYCQGRNLEVYMQGREYLLGQFLQFADRLHKFYCQFERKGQIPPQLIGNAAFTMTMQRPSRAFEMLGQRMMVYLAWANRYPNDRQDAKLVKWTLKELGSISRELKDMDLTSPISPNGKAELLLGYLATGSKENEESK